MDEENPVMPIESNTLSLLAPFYKQMHYWYDSPSKAQDTVSDVRNYTHTLSQELSVKAVQDIPPLQDEKNITIQPPLHRQPLHENVLTSMAFEHPRTLEKAAEFTNSQLSKDNAHCRFCVFENNGSMYLDIVILEENNAKKNETIINITRDNFTRRIESVRFAKGLFLDIDS